MLACKTFSTTMVREREKLGERITDWLRKGKRKVIDYNVLQSSDSEFHCLTVVLWYEQK